MKMKDDIDMSNDLGQAVSGRLETTLGPMHLILGKPPDILTACRKCPNKDAKRSANQVPAIAVARGENKHQALSTLAMGKERQLRLLLGLINRSPLMTLTSRSEQWSMLNTSLLMRFWSVNSCNASCCDAHHRRRTAGTCFSD